MKKIAALLMMTATTAQAGEARFIGEGRLSHPVQYVQLNIQVHSQCFASPLEASRRTDEVVGRIVEVLRSKVDAANPKDGVITTGGFTKPFSKRLSGQTVCEGTFQKVSTVSLKTSALDTFSQDLAEIQEAVLSEMQRSTQSSEPVTFATIAEPQPHLYWETREEVERQALADALQNAKDKLSATLAGVQDLRNLRIASIKEPSLGSGRPIHYERSGSRGDSVEGGVPVEFDELWVNRTLEVEFQF